MAYQTVADSLGSRVELWINSAYAWLDKPIFGHGSGGFDAAYAPHRADHTPWLGDGSLLSIPASAAGATHNEPLQILLTYGVVGFTLVAVLVCLLWRRNPKFLWLIIPLCLIGFPLQAPASAAVIALGLGLMSRS